MRTFSAEFFSIAAEILSAIYTLERESNHPIAIAISKNLAQQSIPQLPISDVSEIAGQGVAGRVHFSSGTLPVLIGKPESIRRATFALHPELQNALSTSIESGYSVALVAIDGIACALIAVGDSIRVDAKEVLHKLHSKNIDTWMLTGDNQLSASAIASELGIPEAKVISQATPEAKIETVKKLRADGKRVLMIGDGVNDAAALAEADLSVAMGTGTDTAIATADITLMRPELHSLLEALDLARRTFTTIRGNLIWAFAYNVILIPVAALGYLNPMYAGGAMAASSLFVVGNSLRLRS